MPGGPRVSGGIVHAPPIRQFAHAVIPCCGNCESHAAAWHEAADVVGVDALLHIPDHRLADRIAGIVDDRLGGNLAPFPLDRYPVAVRPHVVVGAMAVCDIAAGNAVRAADTLEPGSDMVGNIFVLAIIES